jgi:hypothetical protein
MADAPIDLSRTLRRSVVKLFTVASHPSRLVRGARSTCQRSSWS